MLCPKCGNVNSPKKVIRSWTLKCGLIKRKRRCSHCKAQYFTVERIVEEVIIPFKVNS